MIPDPATVNPGGLPPARRVTGAAMIADSFGNPTHLFTETVQMFVDHSWHFTMSDLSYFGGQRFDQRYAAAAAIAASAPVTNRVLYLLGTNDTLQAGNGTWDIANTPAWIDRHLALWPLDAVIVWVNMNTQIVNKPGSVEPARYLNDYMAGIADQRVRTVDWDAAVAANPAYTYDYTHPSTAGQAWLDTAIHDQFDQP